MIWTDYDTAKRPATTTIQDTSGNLLYRAAVSYDSHEHISSQRERVSGANYTTSYSYDWDDRATDIQYGDATHRVRYGYDGQGKPALVSHNGVTYSYLYNLQGDVIGLVGSAALALAASLTALHGVLRGADVHILFVQHFSKP